MESENAIKVQCPQYHIKYQANQCGGLLAFITRRGFNSQYKCTRCGQIVNIVEGMSAKQIENLERMKDQVSGVRHR